MNSNINELLDKLKSNDNAIIGQTVGILAYSGNKKAFSRLMNILENSKEYHPVIIQEIIYSLVDAARHTPVIMDYLLVYLQENPGSEAGQVCAYIIDDVNGLQGV